jgi:hypothetical protein
MSSPGVCLDVPDAYAIGGTKGAIASHPDPLTYNRSGGGDKTAIPPIDGSPAIVGHPYDIGERGQGWLPKMGRAGRDSRREAAGSAARQGVAICRR